MTCQPDHYQKVVKVLPPLGVLESRTVSMLDFYFSLLSGSLAILSHKRNSEFCLSKDQNETPLTSSTEANQTHGRIVGTGS